MTIYYTSNDGATGFDATSVGVLPAVWANKVGTWQVGTTQPAAGHARSLGSVSGADGDVALLGGITARADMQVSLTQKIPGLVASAAPMIGVLLRMDTGYNNGYTVLLDKTGILGSLRFLVFRRVGGGYALIGTSSAIGGIIFAATDTVVLRAQIQGSAISVKLWPTRISEPGTWQYSVTDSTVSAAGYAGLYYGLDSASSAAMGVDDVVVSDLPSVSVTNPGTVTAGAAMVVSGTYAGQDPAGLNYRFDAAGYVAAVGPAIGGGAFSFGVTAPAVGAHTVSVQQSGDTAVTGVSGSFTAVSGSLTVNTPAGALAGRTVAISGSYAGVAPTGLNYRFDAGAYGTAGSPTIGGGVYAFTVAAPALGPHTVSVQEANAASVVAVSASFNVALAPDSAAIAYSPYTWNVQANSATTVNPGAYFRTLFSGATCALNFDVAGMVAPASQIWWRIDNGAWTQASVAASVSCTIPAATAGNADVPYHLLEVAVKSATETQNRWNAGNSTRLVFTGLALAAGGAALAPGAAPIRVLVFGDSITEGVRTQGESAANDTDRNDAVMGWAYRLGALLGAEIGVVGFGASGLSVTGAGGVPSLGTSHALLFGGVARSFTPAPALVVFNIGTNDGAANTVGAMVSVLNSIITACPGVPIAVLRPFNGNQTANLQAAIAACGNPSACRWIDTTGFFDVAYGADGLALHPSGPNNLGRIAPLVAAALRPLLVGTGGLGFRAGFQRGLLG